MGKSPGKWLKTLLFGKKSFRSSSTKSKDSSEKGLTKRNEPSLGDNSPIISEPVLVSTYGNTTLPIVEETHSTDLLECETTLPVVSQAKVDQVAFGTDRLSDCDKLSEEKAATKAQAAIRGFLARKAFLALKGIVRLQALIRGHLVRRQAVATLYAMHAIVRVQAMIRGRSSRRSDIGIQINYTKAQQDNLSSCKSGGTWKENFPNHSLGHKLLFSRVVFKPLQIQLDKEDPNSAASWLGRWHKTHFWKPITKPKYIADSKPQQRKSKSSKSGQSIKTNPKLTKKSPNYEPEKRKNNQHTKTPEFAKTEHEKPKQALRKASFSMLDTEIGKLSSGSKKSNSKTVQEISKDSETASKTVLAGNPSEVSLSLSSNGDSAKKVIHKRRSSISTREAPEKQLLQASTTATKAMPQASTSEEKPLSANRDSDNKSNNRRRSSLSTARLEMPENQLHANVSSTVSKAMPDVNCTENSQSNSGDSGNKSNHRRRSSLSTTRLEISKSELHSSLNISASKVTPDVNSSEEKSFSSNGESGNRSSNRRRSSFSAGLEIAEAELSSSASKSVPSYMASTESAKARVRGQNSPRVITTPDSADKNGLTRRHSLPSGSANGKLKSISPRTQKPVHGGSTKGVIKGERSLNLSRDGSVKSLHAEWRR